MKKSFAFFVLLYCVAIAVLAAVNSHSTTMAPPGFHLACDSAGRFAYTDAHGILFAWSDEISTNKSDVIKAAWATYHWQFKNHGTRVVIHSVDSDWKVCE